MRTMRWGMVVLVLAVAAAVWLWPGDEPAPVIEPVPPPVAAAAPVVQPAPQVQQEAAPPVAEPDAGTRPVIREVQFTLVRDGGAMVGERLTLAGKYERVGGTINVMGFVTLPLAEGEWTVSEPRRVQVSPNKVLIGPDTGLITLTVGPRENLTGCVTSESNKPLRLDVSVRDGSRIKSAFSDADGCFALEVDSAEVELWASNYEYRTAVQHVTPPAKVQLRAAKLHRLWVELKPDAFTSARISVSHRLGVSTGICSPECSVEIPSGPYELFIAAVSNRQLLFARQSGTAPSKDVELVVNLGPAPPVTGVVRNAAGVPLPNVPLRFIALYVSPTDTFGVADSKPVIEMARALTGIDGTFIVQPNMSGAGAFPTWKILAEPPWKLSPAQVSLGDKPVELTAELITP